MITQLEVQKLGGPCARAPVSCMVKMLLERAGLSPAELVVFDTTYGEGRFWAASRPSLLIGADIACLDWVVEPDIFIKKPAWQSWKTVKKLGIHVDVVVVDPPWIERGNSKRRHFGLDKALGSHRLILEAAARATRELGARYLFVHYKTTWVPEGFRVVAEEKWLPVTRYIDYNKENPTTWWGLLSNA